MYRYYNIIPYYFCHGNCEFDGIIEFHGCENINKIVFMTSHKGVILTVKKIAKTTAKNEIAKNTPTFLSKTQ